MQDISLNLPPSSSSSSSSLLAISSSSPLKRLESLSDDLKNEREKASNALQEKGNLLIKLSLSLHYHYYIININYNI